MINGLKPYPAMKESGIDWLGEVPKHWQVRRGKNIFSCVDVRTETGEEDLLTVSSVRGVVHRRSANVTMFKAASYVGYKLCWPGDLVINSLWAWARGLGVSSYHGIISTAYGVYRPKETVDSQFIHELVRSTPFHWELRVRSKGVWTSRLQLTDDSFLCSPFPLPPLAEQAAIGHFLDYVDRRARRYLRAKQKLIGLLEEQKQAIIHRAVTRGLDPDVPLKPSGVEWLGDVPERWEVRRLGRMGRFSKGNGGTKADEMPDGVPCIRYGDLYMHHKFFIETSRSFVSPECATDYTPILQGDVLFAGSGETIEEIGKSAVNLIESEACCGGDVILFRPSRDLVPRFMGYATDCPQATYQKACMGRGVTIMHVYGDQLKYLGIALPSLPEQAVIVEYLDKATTDIDNAIDRARREIELLREYRTRLIADVVTGKLDVREAAANLPEVPEVPEPLDEGDNLMDEGEAIANGLDAEPEEVEA